MGDARCRLCRLAIVNPSVAETARRLYMQGESLHAVHRQLVLLLGNRAPSRSGTYRHLDHVPEYDRRVHEGARARNGSAPTRGAAAESYVEGRSLSVLAAQVARHLQDAGVTQVVASPTMRPQPYAPRIFPEDISIAQGWGRRR